MAEVRIKARRQFGELLITEKRWAIAVCHRRAGKTVACVQKLLKGALECKRPDPRFAYVAPLYNQAKDVAWTYLKRLSLPLDGSANESELRVDLPSGARIRLYGADNPDRLRGLYLDGAVLDEYADMQPSVWGEIVRPMLADRQGWATFIGTPKGHNAFYELWENAKVDPAWFPLLLKASETGLIDADELEDARRTMTADQYAQEFECSFEAAVHGAYYAAGLDEARSQGRISRVAQDPIMTVRLFCDIGGTGKKSDAFAIWAAQFVGREIRVLNYYEAKGQPIGHHLSWMRENKYVPGNARVWLPHDGDTNERIIDWNYRAAFEEAGYEVEVVANQGTGAAKMRIEAGRRLLPFIWFNEDTTKGGREALAAYHERRDEKRNIGLGPEHDWSSHGADAFGLMCVAYEMPAGKPAEEPQRERYTENSWMGG